MTLTYDSLVAGVSTDNVKIAVDDVYTQGPTGSLGSAYTNTLWGINHRQQPNSVPLNRDYYGLTFFTRPMMNMRTDNLRLVRELTPLLASNEETLPRAIRALFDVDAHKYGHGSKLVDDFQAFMPVLTNQLISMGGWPDVTLPTFSSKPGAYQEEFGFVDGVSRIYKSYDITANFRNILGDPITMMFFVWATYMSQVAQGRIVPYPYFIIEKEIDYMTRIYRLVLDPSRRYVQKIAACGASFPLNDPLGNSFNFESDTPINRGNDQISIHFRCYGAIYNDPILVYEFNQTVINQNTNMGDDYRANTMKQLDSATAQLFNNKGYPYIDPLTNELQWWVSNEDYQSFMGAMTPNTQDGSSNEVYNEGAIL